MLDDMPEEGYPDDWPGWVWNGGKTLCVYPNGTSDKTAEYLLSLLTNDQPRSSLLSELD